MLGGNRRLSLGNFDLYLKLLGKNFLTCQFVCFKNFYTSNFSDINQNCLNFVRNVYILMVTFSKFIV
jgi:hypothetical protein